MDRSNTKNQAFVCREIQLLALSPSLSIYIHNNISPFQNGYPPVN